MIGGGAGQQERLGIEGGCSSSWDDVKLSPLTCMSLAMGLAFERGIGFGFVFVSAAFAAFSCNYMYGIFSGFDFPDLLLLLGTCRMCSVL